MSKVHVRVKTMEDKIAEYVENHPEEIYIDYQDGLRQEQIEKILKGRADDVRWEIEDYAQNYTDDYSYYWERCREETGCSQDDIDDWLAEDGFYPSYCLTDDGWRQLLRNTNVNITATVWDADWNFGNWAYGGTVSYSDVKESLKILGINPKEFLDLKTGGSMSGGDKLKGWFPDMPQRDAKIDPKELWDNMIVLYDGVLNFCLGDLEEIIDVIGDDSKFITFKKGTNIVMYDFGNGSGITTATLIKDLTIARKKVQFRDDGNNKYGIQECYGFDNNHWEQGGVRNGE